MFISSIDSALAIAAFNLYYIFMVIYAYIGFNVLLEILKRRYSTIVSILMLAFALLIFSSLAIQLIAVVGVIFTIRKNNEAKLSDL